MVDMQAAAVGQIDDIRPAIADRLLDRADQLDKRHRVAAILGQPDETRRVRS